MSSTRPISLAAARAAVLAGLEPLAAEPVPLAAALGRRLGEDAVARAPVQAFDNSAMDGYAVRAAETEAATPGSPARLRLAGESRAGHPATAALGAGEAMAISTGAALPAGADAVVRVEDTAREGEAVLVRAGVAPGRDVRRAGEDFAAGDTVLPAGTAIGPAELGVLASLDLDPAPCFGRPRVAVLTSGDELVPLGKPLAPGAIRDSNAHSVPAAARLAGADVVSVAWAPDEPRATEAALSAAISAADVAIVCGGVSVGEHDHVKAALARLGVAEEFWRIALRPGGPTWFGRRDATLVFGLPGNPVSALVTFALLARPALLALGGGDPGAPRTRAVLAAGCERPAGRVHAVRCRLELTERGWLAHPFGRQGSHVLTSLVGADALALVPAEGPGGAAGETVEVELLDSGGAAAAASIGR
ncbi:MAG: gephyrin-like molybdotransferase Glp [Syntrophothermus sp.]